jgi:hypothetical protein
MSLRLIEEICTVEIITMENEKEIFKLVKDREREKG